MSDEGQEPTTPTTPADDGKQQDPKTFDADYVKELRQEAASYRTKAKDMENQLAQFAAAQNAARDEELAKKEEWKTLADERAAKLAEAEVIQKSYESLLANIKASNEKRIEAIAEDRRSLVPEYNDPAKVAAWLDANAALLQLSPQAPNLNGGAGGKKTGSQLPQLSDAEIDVAKKMGLTPEQYQQQKEKMKVR